jgi:DNA-binding HxlR family transcriptional regulator
MALFDLLGRRWVLRILWELRAEPLGFRELQRRCESVSPSVLSQRLRDLVDAGLLTSRPDTAYAMTPDGQSLIVALMPLNAWANTWARHRQD